MNLERRLAEELIQRHPERAAVVLERVGLEEATGHLSRQSIRETASILERMSPHFAAAVLESLEPQKIAELAEVLPLDVAARLLRRIAPERADAALGIAGEGPARSLRSLLRFPEGCAGAMMDPEVLALPEGLTAKDALDRIRERPERARYNVYVVDSQQHLTGVMNLRELLLARPAQRISDFMVRNPQRLDARLDRSAVVSHPGWHGVHSLPVVDEQGGYLGAVRYRMLRALQDELFAAKESDADTGAALGQLFVAGAAGLLGALSTPLSTGRDR